MSLDLSKVEFIGPALPESFVNSDLEKILIQSQLLLKTTGYEGKELENKWAFYRKRLRELGINNGAIRVRNIVIEPLLDILGYKYLKDSDIVITREGKENGGFLLVTDDERVKLRCWTVETGKDLEAPSKRGQAYRFSNVNISQRILLSKQEQVGIITDGIELRILIYDAARPASQILIKIQDDWKNSKEIPDSFKLLFALTSPKGIESLSSIIDKARLKQSAITKELRFQAKQAILDFIQEIYSNPKNKQFFNENFGDNSILAKKFWQEGLIIIYRLLFILKGEVNDDQARSFKFTGSSIWRNTYSLTSSLSHFVRRIIDEGIETNSYLESGLKTIFKMFAEGLESSELNITPLGGVLFGDNSTPILSKLYWTELGCAKLLDNLLWTFQGSKGSKSRKRIHYGSLDIEDLGKIYESLLELEPGISSERMCRLRHSKIEVVVPYVQGEKYREYSTEGFDNISYDTDLNDDSDENSKTKIEWIEEIKPGQFYLRIGLGRKASGSYYTPHSFVKFLVESTLGPKIEECSGKDDPYPNKILEIKVLDPAMGSGQFLVEACSFMAEKLYEACRYCDEKAIELENKADSELDLDKKNSLLYEAKKWHDRILEIPDPNDEILYYLPSTSSGEYSESFSRSKAIALCKRLVAVHCIYGVDINPLAVELAKLSLWLESQSEGLPLTFLDHRLIVGDSVSGPFFSNLQLYPISQKPMDDILNQNLSKKLKDSLFNALKEVAELENSIGIDIPDITNKLKAKERLDKNLLPFKILSAAWTGSVMLGNDLVDDFEYASLSKYIAENGCLPIKIESEKLLNAICKGLGLKSELLTLDDIIKKVIGNETIPSVSYDLEFPEVFFELKEGELFKNGFDVILGNPPWDAIKPKAKEFYANYDFEILAAPTKRERESIEKKLKEDQEILSLNIVYEENFKQQHRIHNNLFRYQVTEVDGAKTGGDPDLAKLFLERFYQVCKDFGAIGVVVPSAFHANEGATGIRKLYLEKTSLEHCYSFENKKKLFEIHSRFKFALIVAKKISVGTKEFQCAFYLHDDEWLFSDNDKLKYEIDFLKEINPLYLSFPELKSIKELDIFKICFNKNISFKEFCKETNIIFAAECHMTHDSWRFTPVSDVIKNEDPRNPDILEKLNSINCLLLYEGKNFFQFSDFWDTIPRYLVKYEKLKDRSKWLKAASYYRGVYRKVASSTNERTSIFTIISPGILTGESCIVDSIPSDRNYNKILFLISIANSFVFDWIARQFVAANFTMYIRDLIPIPFESLKYLSFLSHNSLRLISNHKGFLKLWRELMTDKWLEKNEKFSFPIFNSNVDKWVVRSAIDALVAKCYKLSLDQYEIILESFDRYSGENEYKVICLNKFKELEQLGIDDFVKKYDPYWDIPLNENLPEPVIDIPIVSDKKEELNLF